MLKVDIEKTKRRIIEVLNSETPESLQLWYNERQRLWEEFLKADENSEKSNNTLLNHSSVMECQNDNR